MDHLPVASSPAPGCAICLNNTDGAQADLAEAQRIAERGGMKLFLADIALTRARLFEDKAELAQSPCADRRMRLRTALAGAGGCRAAAGWSSSD